MLARLHRDVLKGLIGPDFAHHRLDRVKSKVSLWRRIGGYLDGATPAGIIDTLAAIDAHGADTVWLDGSNLGRVAQALRAARPDLRVLTFCHNVEARFFLGAFRRGPDTRAAGIVAGNYIAERLAVRHSNELVALNARDSDGLARIYRRAADHLLPMAVADQLTERGSADEVVRADAPFLFVGGAFYANQAGIAWFAREVAPRIDARIMVIGQGMEAMRDELQFAPNVQVIGPVDSLEPYYDASRAAIAPIFDGSGMKTKVAEALMFGKRVIGTREAFVGYDALDELAGWRCETADDFVAAIGAAQAIEIKVLDSTLRATYEREHSVEATRRRLAAILALRRENELGEIA